MAYLARTCGDVHIYCDNVRRGYATLREALCGNRRSVKAPDLLAEYGPDTTVQAWADKLRCSRCGSRDHIVIQFLPPSTEYREKE